MMPHEGSFCVCSFCGQWSVCVCVWSYTCVCCGEQDSAAAGLSEYICLITPLNGYNGYNGG